MDIIVFHLVKLFLNFYFVIRLSLHIVARGCIHPTSLTHFEECNFSLVFMKNENNALPGSSVRMCELLLFFSVEKKKKKLLPSVERVKRKEKICKKLSAVNFYFRWKEMCFFVRLIFLSCLEMLQLTVTTMTINYLCRIKMFIYQNSILICW